jgi:hypothetical protein
VGLKLNGTHQLLADADDVNLLGDNTDTVKKNTGTLIGASKEVGLEINVEKTKYMLLSHHQNVGQNRDMTKRILMKNSICQLYCTWSECSTLRSPYRDRLRARRPMGRSSSLSRGKVLIFSTSSR